jgi:hypothetical protein
VDTNEQNENDREVTEQSRHFVVARTDEGWGVWDRRGTEEPLAVYPPGDRGFESAYDHFTRINHLHRMQAIHAGSMVASFWIAVVAGVLWIVSTTIFQVRIDLMADPFQSERAYEAVRWANVVSGIAHPVFLVAFGTFVMLWLRGRRNE